MATTHTVTNDFTVDTYAVADQVDANFNDILAYLDDFDASNVKKSGTYVPVANITGLTSTQMAAAFFKDEDAMTSDSATAVASQQSVKAYVDGKHTTYSGGESYAFAGGLIIKMGHSTSPSGNVSSGTVTITFGTAFSTIVSVVATLRNDTGINIWYSIDSVSTTGFTFYYYEYQGTHAADGFDWIAIGC